MHIVVDIDNTICTKTDGDYVNAKPHTERIEKINKLYNEGHTITYWTARGMNSGVDWAELTHSQLTLWGCKYHTLNMKKPAYDLWIDDKAINSEEYFK